MPGIKLEDCVFINCDLDKHKFLAILFTVSVVNDTSDCGKAANNKAYDVIRLQIVGLSLRASNMAD